MRSFAVAFLASSSALLLAACASSSPPPPQAAPAPPPTVYAAPPAPPPGGEQAIEGWDHRHPEAARELGDWVKAHPAAAPKFFEWDAARPERSREFVTWGIQHPGDSIDVFVLEHRNWEYFDRIMENHRPAAETFLAWARRRPAAAEDLMRHPGGLRWAGDHLYAADWHMEHPHR